MRRFRMSPVNYFKCIALPVCLLITVSFLLEIFTTSTIFDDFPVINNMTLPVSTSTETRNEKDPLLKPDFLKFDCEKLFGNNKNEMRRAKAYLQYHNNSFPDRFYGDYKNMQLDCAKYIKFRGLGSAFVTDVEKGFPIAFNILFHKNVEQLERLLRSIYRRHNQYCIHIDKKTSDNITQAVRQLVGCLENVFVASRQEIVVYASFTRLAADIDCMRDHIQREFKWEYLINMAASEFPVMTNLQIVEILKLFNGTNDIHEVLATIDHQRYRRKHFTYIDVRAKTGHIIHTKQRKEAPPYGLTITKGNAYNIFSRAFVEFVIGDERARNFLTWCEDTLTPDEHYWATLNNMYSNPVLETPGGFKGHPDKKPYFGRYIGWKNDKMASRCKAGNYVHNVCVFSVEDLPMLKQRPEIIANKFDINYDPLAYRCMEEWLRKKTIDIVHISSRHARLYAKLA